MLKKLIQKIKSSKLVQKILSLFTILVVLSSMLVIPSSAADSGITTLEGTTWEFKSNNWTASAGYGAFSLIYMIPSVNGDEPSGLGSDYEIYSDLYIGYYFKDNGDFPSPSPQANAIGLYPPYPLYVLSSESFTITFVGGGDIADPDLISWVTENGDQVLPNHVDPIADVFTGITSWITSAFGTVTGVFYQKPDIDTFTVSSTGTTLNLSFDGNTVPQTWYAVSGFPLDPSSYFDGSIPCSYEFNGTTTDTALVSSTNNFVGTSIVTENASTEFMLYQGVVYSRYLPGATFSIINGDSGLTFLGTLAVVGLSIGIAFLLIGLIQRFLRLRG